jgi:uncharacterized repeat protein (TIGR03987 family)
MRYAACMPRELIVPVIIMSLAFVFYTTGVWSERARRDLRGWHVVLFWMGLACDGYATSLMERLVALGEQAGAVHAVTGFAAFGLMAVHAVWATWVLFRGSRQARERFHRYSIIVWALWLVPYFGGMVAGMARGVNGSMSAESIWMHTRGVHVQVAARGGTL